MLDEILKGTNPIERKIATKGILKYLLKHQAIVFVTTHDLDLAQDLAEAYECYHFTDSFQNNRMHFDYKIHQGISFETNALKLMESLNYPEEVFTL